MMKVFALLTAAILSLAATAEASPPSSFNAAKRIAVQQIYHDQDETFYCGCQFSFEDGPDLEGCGYEIRKQPARAARIEWEHVMPAYDFGRQRQCWQDGGRDNCRRTDPVFRMAEADLHNLVPVIGEVNGDRSNMRFAMVNSPAHEYGACDAAVSFEERAFQPPANRRGDIARTYWYMRDTYGIQISRQQQQLFTAWAAQDPVDDWELERNRRIVAIQGNGNPYVSTEDLPPAPELITPSSVLEDSFSTPSLPTGFSCDTRKTCGQMSSCEEAYYHLLQCGNGRLDGDNDGVPCESICR